MSLTARKAIFAVFLTAIALSVTACTSTRSYRTRGGARNQDRQASWPWPERHTSPSRSTPSHASASANTAPSDSAAKPARSSRSRIQGLNIIPRSRWTNSHPIRSRVNLMHGINRITVHHEGWTPVYFTDMPTTAKRIAKIRKIHTRDRGWGDIGYHYVIDRAGRIWEARPRKYQGAHVEDHNRHNLGILCLGNFNKQNPSRAQLNTLVRALYVFQHAFHVPTNRIYSHRELGSTACPGRNIQRHMDAIRSRLRQAN